MTDSPATQFEALARAATQGEVEHFYAPSAGGISQPTNALLVDGKDVVVHWTGFDAARTTEQKKRANAAFIAFCFNHRALIAAALRGGEDGWVSVPREPTEAMLEKATGTISRSFNGFMAHDGMKKAYAAMLAARPLPPSPGAAGSAPR